MDRWIDGWTDRYLYIERYDYYLDYLLCCAKYSGFMSPTYSSTSLVWARSLLQRQEELEKRKARGEDVGVMAQFSAMKSVMGRLQAEMKKESHSQWMASGWPVDGQWMASGWQIWSKHGQWMPGVVSGGNMKDRWSLVQHLVGAIGLVVTTKWSCLKIKSVRWNTGDGSSSFILHSCFLLDIFTD